MLDKLGNRVHLVWGSTCLETLHRELCHATLPSAKMLYKGLEKSPPLDAFCDSIIMVIGFNSGCNIEIESCKVNLFRALCCQVKHIWHGPINIQDFSCMCAITIVRSMGNQHNN
ncbi:hypothetical protein CR513_19070, partial [Mucuna pruriens]